MSELAAKGLLEVVKEDRREPMSPTKNVIEHACTLRAPFAQDWRTATLATVSDLPVPGAAQAAEGA